MPNLKVNPQNLSPQIQKRNEWTISATYSQLDMPDLQISPSQPKSGISK